MILYVKNACQFEILAFSIHGYGYVTTLSPLALSLSLCMCVCKFDNTVKGSSVVYAH